MTDIAIKYGLPPVYAPTARVLVLGSLPGEASLAAQQYYAHPGNQFWRLLETVTGRPLVPLAYPDRLKAVTDSGIALWDMVEAGRRPGSLDHRLKADRLRDISAFTADLPGLRAIAFNGTKAAALGATVTINEAIARLSLPSSSAANTMPFAQKRDRWQALAGFL